MPSTPTSREVLWVYPAQDTAGYEIVNEIDHGIIRKPPLGMLYLAAVLRDERGLTSRVWDQTVRPFSTAQLAEHLRQARPRFVGIYVDTELREKVLDMVAALVAAVPDVPVLVGGPGTQQPDAYVHAGATATAIGEAEHTIVDIDRALCGELPWDRVAGIALPDGQGGVRRTAARPLIEDLDSLPFPDRSLLDVNDYYDWQIIGMRRPYITVMASRGCYFRCTFCSSPQVWGHKVRLRSPADVVEEIGDAVARWGVRYVGFHDDIFGFRDDWSDEFTALMAAQPWRVRWACMAHPFTFKKGGRAKLEAWRKAGCDFIAFGLQTANDDVLREIQRSGREPENLANAVAICKELGILTKVEFIFGLPGDTRESMAADLDFALRVRPHVVKFYNLSLLEGSDLGDRYSDNADVCTVPFDQVQALTARAMRRYYTSPTTIRQLAGYAVRHHPRWLLWAVRRAPFLVQATGLR